jgi:hypothetical protein
LGKEEGARLTPSKYDSQPEQHLQFICLPRRSFKNIQTDLACIIILGHNTFRSNSLKILAISDMVVDHLYSTQIAERFHNIELILGSGD